MYMFVFSANFQSFLECVNYILSLSGYEQFHLFRSDPALCFKAMVGEELVSSQKKKKNRSGPLPRGKEEEDEEEDEEEEFLDLSGDESDIESGPSTPGLSIRLPRKYGTSRVRNNPMDYTQLVLMQVQRRIFIIIYAHWEIHQWKRQNKNSKFESFNQIAHSQSCICTRFLCSLGPGVLQQTHRGLLLPLEQVYMWYFAEYFHQLFWWYCSTGLYAWPTLADVNTRARRLVSAWIKQQKREEQKQVNLMKVSIRFHCKTLVK